MKRTGQPMFEMTLKYTQFRIPQKDFNELEIYYDMLSDKLITTLKTSNEYLKAMIYTF